MFRFACCSCDHSPAKVTKDRNLGVTKWSENVGVIASFAQIQFWKAPVGDPQFVVELLAVLWLHLLEGSYSALLSLDRLQDIVIR